MLNKRKLHKIVSYCLQLATVLSSLYGLIIGYYGVISFTYFTQLSNIFLVVVLLIAIINDIKKYKFIRSQYIDSMRYMATICITITFLVFAFLLAPVFGGLWKAYFAGGNCSSFCLHCLSPILAITDFFYDVKVDKITYKYFIYGTIPPLSYIAFIIFMGQVFKVRWFGMLAPYNFLNYGAACGWFGFDIGKFDSTTVGIGVFYIICILIAFFNGLGYCYLFINKNINEKRKVV